MPTKYQQKVPFRMFQTPCCGTVLCWVNHRLPNYCPECGKRIYAELKFGGFFRGGYRVLAHDDRC